MTDHTETDTQGASPSTSSDADSDAAAARDAAASPEAVDRLARQYTEQGRPFARVTVVRREAPVSAHVGDRAVVTPDGELVGWIGGVACAQSVAIREAKRALRGGEPTLVGIAPDPDSIDRPGLEAFPMNCHSQGTLELYIEPVTTPARLVIVGDSPIARSLATLAGELAYEVTAVAPSDSAVPGADRHVATPSAATDLAAELRGATWVVAASMGASDDIAIEAALDAEIPYIGLVASNRRADELCARVGERLGLAADAVRERIHAPAGLDIGARSPEEIGVSILAELVSMRRSEASADAAVDSVADADDTTNDTTNDTTDGATDETTDDMADADDGADVVTDPVCGMDVTVGEEAATATHDGTTYYFCGVGCQESFVDDPERFLERVEP